MRTHRVGLAAAVLCAALTAAAFAGSVSAAGNTLRLEPAATTVAKDATFTVKVVQNATVATSGAQVTIAFDKAIIRVQSVTRGAPYASSPLFLAADAKAIETANRSGRLKTVAAAFFPPASVPAGDQEFLVVEFKAIACGQSDLALPVGAVDAAMLDGREATYGAPLKITTKPGRVVVDCGGGVAGSTATPVPSGVTPAPSAPGDVAAATFDPLASPSHDPLAQPSSDPAPDSPSGDPGVSAPTLSPAAAETTTDSRQDAWLTFALASLAVAAAGLALAIAVIVLATLIAGFVGTFLLIRYLRRGPGGAPAAADAGPDGDGGVGSVEAAPGGAGAGDAASDGRAAAADASADAAADAPTQPVRAAHESRPAPAGPGAPLPPPPTAG